jgi:hypothetical protein
VIQKEKVPLKGKKRVVVDQLVVRVLDEFLVKIKGWVKRGSKVVWALSLSFQDLGM